jgi:hypothetical protein
VADNPTATGAPAVAAADNPAAIGAPAVAAADNPAATGAPAVPAKPEINGVPEINYMPMPGEQILPPPPTPPIAPVESVPSVAAVSPVDAVNNLGVTGADTNVAAVNPNTAATIATTSEEQLPTIQSQIEDTTTDPSAFKIPGM